MAKLIDYTIRHSSYISLKVYFYRVQSSGFVLGGFTGFQKPFNVECSIIIIKFKTITLK